MKNIILAILFCTPLLSYAARITPSNPEIRDNNGVLMGKVKADGTFWIKEINVTDDVDAETNSYSIRVATDTGLPAFNTNSAVVFSTGVTITGELTVQSAKARAIHIPAGGLIVGEDQADIAPGHIRSNRIKTSTLTLTGSAILFEDPDTGVIQSTWTRTGGIDLGTKGITTSGEVKGKLKNDNSGPGVPASSACDETSEIGQIYASQTPSRMYFCVDDGAAGAEWRYTNLSP